MNLDVDALRAFVSALDVAQIPYQIGGSFASGAWGEARATHDVDVAIMIQSQDVPTLVEELGDPFILDGSELANAIESSETYRMAQAIHLESMLKFDLFVVADSPYTREAFQRSRLIETPFGEVVVACAETIVLEKLRWYELGNRVSDRQWNDIVQVLEVQAGRLDLDYLERWAKHFGVDELLALAIEQSDPFG